VSVCVWKAVCRTMLLLVSRCEQVSGKRGPLGDYRSDPLGVFMQKELSAE